jgi:hypothetical protein
MMNYKEIENKTGILPSILFTNCVYASYNNVGDCVSYAFVEKDDTLYIYFQGSSSIADWVRNFWFFKKPYKDMETPYYVHGGFLAAWKEVEDIVINKITETLPDSSEYKWKRIVTIGYSHGGALSGLCHECVWFHRPDIRDNIFGIGFESPRFYHGFAVKKQLQERWKNYVVFRNHNDIVTRCPPFLFGFCHVGQVITIGRPEANSMELYKKPHCIGAHYPERVFESLVYWELNS